MSKELTLFASRFLNSSVLLGDSQVVRGIKERSAGAGNPVSDVRTLDVELEGMWRKETFYAALHHRLNIVVLLVIQRPGRSIVGGLRLYDGNSWKQKKCKISIWLRSVVIIGTSIWLDVRWFWKNFLPSARGIASFPATILSTKAKSLYLTQETESFLRQSVYMESIRSSPDWMAFLAIPRPSAASTDAAGTAAATPKRHAASKTRQKLLYMFSCLLLRTLRS